MTAGLYVALGGAIGSAVRYLIGSINSKTTSVFPWKTLLINILGSFLIGLIAAAAEKKSGIDPNLILFLKTGFCGGFTTFSTFALETTTLIETGRTGSAFLYLFLSVTLSCFAVFAAGRLV